MDLSFNKVTYDSDLSDFSEDELRELVGEFETAQEANVAEFEKAADATEEIDESTIEDFKEAREALIDDITGADAFDEVPLTEDKLEDENFSDLQDWRDFVAEDTSDEEDEVEDEGGGFDDFGKKSPKNPEGEEQDFVEETLDSIQGLNVN